MPSSCLYGCGDAPTGISARYLPGHDARHAAAVGRRLIALGRVEPAVLDELPTEALRRKAAAMVTSTEAWPVAGRSTPSEALAAEEPAVTAERDLRSVQELLAEYTTILRELRLRKVIRSDNAPAGDYGEWIVARALDGTLVENLSGKSFDLTLPDSRRVQVKTRVVTNPPKAAQLQTSPFRSFDFELAALVLLRKTDYAVHRAVLVPVGLVQERARRVDHVNGWRLPMTNDILDHQDAEDFTAVARRAARSEE